MTKVDAFRDLCLLVKAIDVLGTDLVVDQETAKTVIKT